MRHFTRKIAPRRHRVLRQDEEVLPTDDLFTPEKKEKQSKQRFFGNRTETLSVMDNQDRNYLKIF